jgi:hypothetical protein
VNPEQEDHLYIILQNAEELRNLCDGKNCVKSFLIGKKLEAQQVQRREQLSSWSLLKDCSSVLLKEDAVVNLNMLSGDDWVRMVGFHRTVNGFFWVKLMEWVKLDLLREGVLAKILTPDLRYEFDSKSCVSAFRIGTKLGIPYIAQKKLRGLLRLLRYFIFEPALCGKLESHN